MRFRPEQHLRRQCDIRAVREQGRRLDGGVFALWWRRRPPGEAAAAELARVCVVASTASVGCAVRRNRAKRRMRELFRRHQGAVAAGCDLLMVARSGLLRLPQGELDRRFLQIVERIRPSSGTVKGGAPGAREGNS